MSKKSNVFGKSSVSRRHSGQSAHCVCSYQIVFSVYGHGDSVLVIRGLAYCLPVDICDAVIGLRKVANLYVPED